MATAGEPNFKKIYKTLIHDILGDVEKSIYGFVIDEADGHAVFINFLRSTDYESRTDPPSGSRFAKHQQSKQRKKTGEVKQVNQEFRLAYLANPEKRAKYGKKAVNKLRDAGVLGQLNFPGEENYRKLLASAANKPAYGPDILKELLINYWVYPTFYTVSKGFDDSVEEHAYPTSGYSIFSKFAEEDPRFSFLAKVLGMCQEMRFVGSQGVKGYKEAVRIFMDSYRPRFNFHKRGDRVPKYTSDYITISESQYELLEKYAEELKGYDWFGLGKARPLQEEAQQKSLNIKKNINMNMNTKRSCKRNIVEKDIYWC